MIYPYIIRLYYIKNEELVSIEFQEYDDLEYTNICRIVKRMEEKLGEDIVKNILVKPDVSNLMITGYQTSLTLH
tara:strand:+ start:546 stop:767 length:222 start_codon:yes stop_codon:yes gene_type:complete